MFTSVIQITEFRVKGFLKGGLISESFFILAQISPKMCPKLSCALSMYKEKMLIIVILHLFGGDLRQSEKQSEIKPPLTGCLMLTADIHITSIQSKCVSFGFPK